MQADLSWVYTFSPFLGIMGGAIALYFLLKCLREKKLNREVHEQREQGLHQTWGTKVEIKERIKFKTNDDMDLELDLSESTRQLVDLNGASLDVS